MLIIVHILWRRIKTETKWKLWWSYLSIWKKSLTMTTCSVHLCYSCRITICSVPVPILPVASAPYLLSLSRWFLQYELLFSLTFFGFLDNVWISYNNFISHVSFFFKLVDANFSIWLPSLNSIWKFKIELLLFYETGTVVRIF